jgi:small subunit ribosomal protein S5
MKAARSRKNNASGEQTAYDLNEKIVKVSRTAKVVKGGRVFGFLALVVVGDGKGKVGFGLGKGKEVPVAIQKAMHDARSSMQTIILNGSTLQHAIIGKHGATRVFMRPASEGTGVIAGGAMRPVFEVLGVEDVLAKIIGNSNPFNVVRATIQGLSQMLTPESVAKRRGMPLNRLLRQMDRNIEPLAEGAT